MIVSINLKISHPTAANIALAIRIQQYHGSAALPRRPSVARFVGDLVAGADRHLAISTYLIAELASSLMSIKLLGNDATLLSRSAREHLA